LDLVNDSISELETLDAIPPPDTLPYPWFEPKATWGEMFDVAFEIDDQRAADEWLRELVIFTLRHRNVNERIEIQIPNSKPYVSYRLRAIKVNEAFALVRANLATYAGCIDLLESFFKDETCKLARRHVEQLFKAIDPAVGSVDAPKRKLEQSKLEAVKFKRERAKARRGETPWSRNDAGLPKEVQPVAAQTGLFEI